MKRVMRLFRFIKRKPEIYKGDILCPTCGAIAFTKEELPTWMKSGYCFKCGQKLDWEDEI